jgi:hypothetical protein
VNYDVGDSVKLTAAFTNDAGAPADPDGIDAIVRTPGEVSTVYTAADFTHPTVGAYELTVIATEAGEWTWRVAGTGAVTAASEGHFYVTESAF